MTGNEKRPAPKRKALGPKPASSNTVASSSSATKPATSKLRASKPATSRPSDAKPASSKAVEPRITEAKLVEAELVEADELGTAPPLTPEHGDPYAGDDVFVDDEPLAADAELNGLDEGTDGNDTRPLPARVRGGKSRLPVPVPPSADRDEAVSASDPVATYLAEIRRYPLLSKEKERELAILYHETGDRLAAEALITANLRFVVKIAAEYSKFGAKLIDLIQEGNVGLMHAVREFNPYKGVRLITYAVWWIRGYIQEYLMRQYSMVRIGTTQAQRKLFYRLQKEKDLLDSLGQGASVPLLSSRLGVSEEDVQQMSQRLAKRDVSLNQPLDTESNVSLIDLERSSEPGIDEQLGTSQELAVLRRNVEKIRPQLNEKELFILDRRMLADNPLTLQEIGDHFGVTREAVRQLEARLIKRLRMAFEADMQPSQSSMDDSMEESDDEDPDAK